MGTNDAEVENQKNPQTNTFTSDLPLSEVENQKNLQAKPFNSNPTLSLPNPEFDEEPERDSSNSNTETRSLVSYTNFHNYLYVQIICVNYVFLNSFSIIR